MRWQPILAILLILTLFLVSGCLQRLTYSGEEDEDTFISTQRNLTCPYECCSPEDSWNEKKCFYEKQVCRKHICEWAAPIDVLNDLLVFELDIKCQSSDKSEIADCILGWQESHMFYCVEDSKATTKEDMFINGYPDCNEPLQLNEMKPGSFPVSEILARKKEGKPYGTNFEFAVTFCALARWHGLKCRVMASKTLSNRHSAKEAGYCGLVRKSLLLQIDESCEDWQDLAWETGPEHYWAEVLFGDDWLIKEANQAAYPGGTENAFKRTEDYYDTGW